jgi:hypothetical protein
MSNHNPYTPGVTITDPAMFFGRAAELAVLRDAIRKGSSKAVVGLRRIGKSSLLHYLARRDDQLPDQIAIVYLDLLDGRYHTVHGLLGGLLTGLSQATNQRYPLPAPLDMGGFTETVSQMKRDGYQPVVCLDELERLMTHPEIFDRSFFEAWRALGSLGTLAFVTASRAHIGDVVRHNGLTSPFANIFTELSLAGLDENAARALLTEPFRRANRPAPPAAHLDRALALGGRHPFFLHLAGERLWRLDGVNQAAFRSDMSQAAEQPLRQLWNDLSPTEQAAALRLATGKGAAPNWPAAQEKLLTAGLAERDEKGNPRLFSDLLAEWLRQGTFQQSAASRAVPAVSPVVLQPSQPPPRPLYASALLFMAGLLGISLLAQWLNWGVWLIFLLLALYLAYTLVGEDKITGREFVDMLDKWLRDLFRGLGGKG